MQAFTKNVRTTTADPWEWAHTPAGTPAGVLVVLINYDGSTDHVSTVTYGGASLSEVVQASDTSGEQTNTQIWFLGSGVPTGTQTVSVDLSTATGDDLVGWVITVTADPNTTQVIDSDSMSNDAQNPQVTLQYGGRQAMAFCALAGGLAAVSDYTLVANCSTIDNNDSRQEIQRIDRQTNAGTSDFTIGYTASSDDVSFCAVAIAQTEQAATGLGSLTLTGLAPTLARGFALTAGLGALTLTGYAPFAVRATTIEVPAGSLTWSGAAPTVLENLTTLRVTQVPVDVLYSQAPTLQVTQVPVDVLYEEDPLLLVTQITVDVLYQPSWYPSPDPATLTFTGYAPTVVVESGQQDFIVTPAAGSVTVTGLTPTVVSGVVRAVPAGSLSLSGAAPAVVEVAFRAPGVGALSLVGQAPTVLTGAVVGVPAGSLSLTGAMAPSLRRDFVVGVPAGTLTLTGLAPAQQGIISVPVGQVGLTGQAPTVVVTRVITVPAGSLTLTGTTSTVTPGQIIAVPAGALTLTGAAPDLGSYVITVPAAALVLTGTQAEFDAPRTIMVPAGALTLMGATAAIRETQVIVVPAGSLTFTGPAVYALISPPLPATVTATVRPMRRLRRSPFVGPPSPRSGFPCWPGLDCRARFVRFPPGRWV